LRSWRDGRRLIPDIYFGRHMAGVPDNSIVFFPCSENILFCGLAGIVSFKKKKTGGRVDAACLDDMVKKIEAHGYSDCINKELSLVSDYLGGERHLISLMQAVRALKEKEQFCDIFKSKVLQNELSELARRLLCVVNAEKKIFADRMGYLEPDVVNAMSRNIENLRDIEWCLTYELAENIKKIKDLLSPIDKSPSLSSLISFKNINAVLNSIDRLEVRGRDSAGMSLMFILDANEFANFQQTISNNNYLDHFNDRLTREVLVNRGISTHETKDEAGNKLVNITIVYKIAAEVGSLGDNVNFLRNQIKKDPVLQTLIFCPHKYHTVSAHTRWASVGVISEPNCHPVDNNVAGSSAEKCGIIHVCLNGDIDNYQELKREHENSGSYIHNDITTDTKIIPLHIEKYVQQGCDISEAFRLAVNDFKGSHAISMHTDLAPGRLFLAQRGSGQTIFIGLAPDHYMPTSEVYGFVEETPLYLKMNGEHEVDGKNGVIQGQIYILNQESCGGVDGIEAMFYDGTRIEIKEKDIKQTDITPRDIDRQDFSHYFLKEIMESPVSVEKTLQNRWKIKEGGNRQYTISFNQNEFPESIRKALVDRKIRRIFFAGQGTAGVAAMVCADIMNYYMGDTLFPVSALKASELSGFKLNDYDNETSMADTLVVAISQSGTTTDTNCTIDMVKKRGAYTLAIVNRRDSDITFKVDGVIYTSSGRDIEMSVASTKAFYSQIVAGALIGLNITSLLGRRNDLFEAEEIQNLLELPDHMRQILAMREEIEKSAKRLAATKTYWAAVGSGPNKASADEIRIKLSELCYKTISSDFVEDKKHIDLSSEPLIIVCAAGTKNSVIGDIIKDTAIFKAHNATPVIIADEGEDRFDPYAADVFHVPIVEQHFAPVVNTLVGHIWGYYAALAINEGSRFMYMFREELKQTIDDYTGKGLDVYEVILEKSFREKTAKFYAEYRNKALKCLPASIGFETASNLTLLLKYLSGRLPVSDFELDFGVKGTPLNMINNLFKCLGESISCMARPVDAIKHQAKTVTVGTSRISEKVEGMFFEALEAYNFKQAQLINRNILVLKNFQKIVSSIKGSILYRISDLNLLGEPTDKTRIEIVSKEGSLRTIPSRVEKDTILKGTKRIIVLEGNVYIGRGRLDERSIIILPVISASHSRPNTIEYLLLLNISFKEDVPLSAKIRALGGKYERIKNIVQESSIVWDDKHLELVKIRDLFGVSAEKISEMIVARAAGV